MIDKWVTSLRFNEIKINKCLIGFLINLFSVGFPGSDIILGSQCGCHLRFFSKLCMHVVDKKLTMPAYCVAASCNNSQMTPGITMHELPRNWPAVRQKRIKFIQFKRADFLAATHHTHLCSKHFSECDFANPMECHMGFASKLTRCSSTLSKDRLKLIWLYPCGSLRQSINFIFRAWVGHFAATPQSDVVGIWSLDLGIMAMLSVRQKMPFFVHL